MELAGDNRTKVCRLERSFDRELLRLRQLFQPNSPATQMLFRNFVVPTVLFSTEILEQDFRGKVEKGPRSQVVRKLS